MRVDTRVSPGLQNGIEANEYGTERRAVVVDVWHLCSSNNVLCGSLKKMFTELPTLIITEHIVLLRRCVLVCV